MACLCKTTLHSEVMLCLFLAQTLQTPEEFQMCNASQTKHFFGACFYVPVSQVCCLSFYSFHLLR